MTRRLIWTSALAAAIAFTVNAEDKPQREVLTANLTQPMFANWKSFDDMNDTYSDRFVTRKGFGFSRMIDLERMKTINIAGKQYHISKVQLVGIAEHGKPALYQTHADANKENIKKAKTRPLDAAETRALAAVRGGSKWVMASTSAGSGKPHDVMIGSLRAREKCLKCHEDAKVGDLLGAFRYEIVPVPHAFAPNKVKPASKRKAPKKKVDPIS